MSMFVLNNESVDMAKGLIMIHACVYNQNDLFLQYTFFLVGIALFIVVALRA